MIGRRFLNEFPRNQGEFQRDTKQSDCMLPVKLSANIEISPNFKFFHFLYLAVDFEMNVIYYFPSSVSDKIF